MQEALLALLAGALLCGQATAEKLQRVDGRDVIPGRILLRLADDEKAAGQVKTLGFEFTRSCRLARAQIWRTPRGMSVARAIRIARRMPGVVAVEPDYVRKIEILPNDPSYTKQFAPGKMDLPEVWDLRTAADDVIVAVIDTGIQQDHPDLAGNIYVNPNEQLNGEDSDGNGYVDDVSGWDLVGPDLSDPAPDNDPSDVQGHGTKVSGVVGAIGNNALGVAGAVWKVRILPIKIGEDSTTATLSLVASIEAVDYAVGQGAMVINASYSGDTYSHFELDALQAAQDAGVIMVTASGNSGDDIDVTPAYPSSHNLANILSLAATTSSDSMPSWSNFGAKTVDLAAPGSSVYTTAKTNTYRYASGTSFSTPNVAGIAALMRSEYPTMNVRKLRLMIMEGTDPVPSHRGKTVTGGRANAYSSFTAPMPWTKTYAQTLPTPRTITDNDPAGITETINVPDNSTIRAVSVFVEVDHPWMGDLGLSIESPAGTVNILQEAFYDDNSGFSLTFDTQFDFRNESSAGDWTLNVSDHGPQDVGTLVSWGLEIYVDGPPQDVNGDGCVNILDLLAVRNSLHGSPGREDVDGDGAVNVLDLLSVRNAAGICEDD